ncbi:5-hydroxytryptamine receptor 1F [Cocos nucifera]|uniref:5-hydroxytryptamine receptor 1F n=1 Tax=Cocos nucifera TaxID=13894 RepID=A0A8K0IUX6_COCNU|nr:5-hydroxytryptamine receptor 1F [Cocos nucifera]
MLRSRQSHHQLHQNPLRRRTAGVGAAVSLGPPPGSRDKFMSLDSREPEERAGRSEESSKSSANSSSSSGPMAAPSCNLDRFLKSTTPSVPAQYLPKTRFRGWRTCDVEYRPYFTLGNLWDSFKEWSAYGAGVPLVLNDSDCVVQYYVPYLSGIQLYGEATSQAISSWRPGEESDGDCYKDSSSDGSSDCDNEKDLKYSRNWYRNHLARTSMLRMDRPSLREKHATLQEGVLSDDGEAGTSQGCLLFEYLEQDSPYSREPLADKASSTNDLACCFPELRTLRSCDLLPASWISVAWYPIYRIPTGPTLKDLDACFLTFHALSTSFSDANFEAWIDEGILFFFFTSVFGYICAGTARPVTTNPQRVDGVPKICLTAFGLSFYKFKPSMWTSRGRCERQLASSLLHAADSWLQLLHVDHPDYQFFASHGAFHGYNLDTESL